ncbi:YagE family protein [Drepanopeziza brunnea f. sp. 'multigermtubi' MB_m1]|uniref:YagE family protein n=1 Tax=Marssonina brunnea f. sp. multigermtubi (strain MB_m1) TaxID=1072389 RepID=K1WXA2_MARBU|nr:YagE family protein [Drepanopeziza brunnea f. sp. 'multigermtubi' MB_m1]EKD17676.1 YagE family protein [Drepanopeziza brunnea f. sp. 'multigermtubi' MB_m1]
MQSLGRPFRAPAARRLLTDGNLRPQLLRSLHATAAGQAPRRRNFFSSNANLQQQLPPSIETATATANDLPPQQKRKSVRSPAGKTSLRRVAVEAQRSRESTTKRQNVAAEGSGSNNVTAISVADQFDMDAVVRILRSHGFPIDPDATGFEMDQVIHTRGVNNGDIFVFPSGSVVAWSLPEDVVADLATKTLLPAAVIPHTGQMEMEDLEYTEDPKRENSTIKGDMIILGTKSGLQGSNTDSRVDTTLAKIAFSSGLARSTKLAVLETMLSRYLESTRAIPTTLSRGAKLPFSRKFMLQKTGELLELRAQLNHYSELIDSLPDLFWDSKYELGLEGYYDQVGRALDVGVRIKALNEKLDYAQEIASILRQTMSEKHGIHLEWIIIILIAVEHSLAEVFSAFGFRPSPGRKAFSDNLALPFHANLIDLISPSSEPIPGVTSLEVGGVEEAAPPQTKPRMALHLLIFPGSPHQVNVCVSLTKQVIIQTRCWAARTRIVELAPVPVKESGLAMSDPWICS